MTTIIDPTPFRFDGSQKFSIEKLPTRIDQLYEDKKGYKQKLRNIQKQLDNLQQKMYADDRYAGLFIFQAMDAAGKDGAIRDVFFGVNPHGVNVHDFKQPSSAELDQNYYWRTDLAMPARGHLGVFNRSYYEEVLVVRVHPSIATDLQRLPKNKTRNFSRLWEERFRQIREREQADSENGMLIAKFFLNISKEEQARRFLSRIDEPEKNWKFNEGDIKERGYWDKYMQAYTEAIQATAAPHAPWYAIPADDKKTARLLIATAVLQELSTLPLEWPKISKERRKELEGFRVALEKEIPSK